MKLANSALQEWMGPFANDVGIAYNTFTTKKDVSPLPIPRIPAGRLEIGTIIKIEAEASTPALRVWLLLPDCIPL